jgi:gliding motility-associated lipoprotein GldH
MIIKQKFKIFVFVALAFILFGSCEKGKVYQKRYDFDNYTWERLTDNKTVTFKDINIEDTTDVYDIYVTIRHTPYINEKEIKFVMKIIASDGITRQSVHSIKLLDRYGKDWVGEAAGDLIDVEEKCRSLVSFPYQGTYTVTLTNLGEKYKTLGIMDIGIKVMKADIDKYKNAQ